MSEVDSFGRTRPKNYKKSETPSPPRKRDRRRSRSPRRPSPRKGSRSPSKREHSPRRSSPRRRSRSPRRSPRRSRGSPRRTSPHTRHRSKDRHRRSNSPTFRKAQSPGIEDTSAFDSAVSSYVSSLKKKTKPRGVEATLADDEDDPVLAAALEDDSNLEEEQMAKLMGFSTFDTTKGKKTEGSTNASGIFKQPKRKYRQYMNRRGGFNRPLDPIL